MRNFNQFLHRFSTFNTVFRHFDYQNLILTRNKRDIWNQHKNLHRIANIPAKYFFHRNLTCTPPQPFFSKSKGEGPRKMCREFLLYRFSDGEWSKFDGQLLMLNRISKD